MQVSSRARDWLVDTLALRRHLGPALHPLLADPNVVKVRCGALRPGVRVLGLCEVETLQPLLADPAVVKVRRPAVASASAIVLPTCGVSAHGSLRSPPPGAPEARTRREVAAAPHTPRAAPVPWQVLHGADHDVLWLQRDFNLYLVNLFDTGQVRAPSASCRLLAQGGGAGRRSCGACMQQEGPSSALPGCPRLAAAIGGLHRAARCPVAVTALGPADVRAGGARAVPAVRTAWQ